MSTSLFENMEGGDLDDVEYRHLEEGDVDADDDDLEEEFNGATQLARGSRPWFWWPGLICVGILCLTVAAAFLHWIGPLFIDKVIIPLIVWESTEFSTPVLAVVLVCSLSIFPTFVLPSGPSMWLAGMMFGYGYGFLIIMCGTTVGQTLPYFIGHWLLHDRIQMWLSKYPKKAAVLRVAEQGGWPQHVRTITLLRLSPIPYPLFNYIVTATNIEYTPYIIGSFFGMVPEAFITIYSGRLLSTLADIEHRKRPMTPVEIIFNSVGACLAVTTAITATVYGRRALKEMELKEAAEREVSEHLLSHVITESPPGSFKPWATGLESTAARSLDDFPPPV